jgi:hypothetical protein
MNTKAMQMDAINLSGPNKGPAMLVHLKRSQQQVPDLWVNGAAGTLNSAGRLRC